MKKSLRYFSLMIDWLNRSSVESSARNFQKSAFNQFRFWPNSFFISAILLLCTQFKSTLTNDWKKSIECVIRSEELVNLLLIDIALELNNTGQQQSLSGDSGGHFKDF